MRNTLMATAPALLWDVRADLARQVVECLQVREALECRAVARAAHGVSSQRSAVSRQWSSAGDLLGAARVLATRIERCGAHTDPAELHKLDVQFHRAVHDVGGNAVLADYAERLHREALELCGANVRALSRQVDAWLADHRHLLAAIDAGDGLAAQAIARRHVRSLLAAPLAAQP